MGSKSSSGLRMDALNSLVSEDAVETLIYVEVDDVMPDPQQPRREFDEASLEEMAASLRDQGGNIVPIEIRENPAGSPPYIMNDGERRWRAASRVAGMKLKAILYSGDVDSEAIHDRQFIANFHRDNMSIADQAAYLSRRREELGSVEELSKRLQLSQARIYKIIGTSQLQGVAAEARDEGLSKDPETLNGLKALEKRDAQAAQALVEKARESGGKISRNEVAGASRKARQSTPSAPPKSGKSKGATKGKEGAKAKGDSVEGLRQAQPQPGDLAVYVRVEPSDAAEEAAWKALSALGDAALCMVSLAEADGHAVVIAGGRAAEFRIASIQLSRVGARHGA